MFCPAAPGVVHLQLPSQPGEPGTSEKRKPAAPKGEVSGRPMAVNLTFADCQHKQCAEASASYRPRLQCHFSGRFSRCTVIGKIYANCTPTRGTPGNVLCFN